ncbi:hypothetical protein [Alicyclobacillus shizuokensis]|uniref:hypothetical protein n=1 Tax=Alicyclobacillus shizuokensis TaxID=392014 RepID=UPI000832D42B|nr:hypothetical protein [Alicyclobacillus shizuokensis]
MSDQKRPRRRKTWRVDELPFETRYSARVQEKPAQPKKRARKARKLAREEKRWTGRFIGFDGEGWDGKYTLVQMSGEDTLYSAKGLDTHSILHYLMDRVSGRNALVGFGLSYDIENILRDVPDADYDAMVNRQEKVDYEGYLLSYIPRKMLTITQEMRNGKKRTVQLVDVLGFFQSSFIGALQKWQIDVPDIIRRGKTGRGEFTEADLPFVEQYNRYELIYLVKLMEALREADEMAWKAIGLQANHGPRIWYGPGSRAANFLNQTAWVDEHPALRLPEDTPEWAKESLLPRHLVEAEAERMAQEEREWQGMRRDIVADVLAHGGLLTPTSTMAYATEFRERVPVAVRRKVARKTGLPLDQMADVLGMSVSDLINQLATWEQPEKIVAEDYEPQARQALMHEASEETWADAFAAAYYGGRIEAAFIGEFDGPLYGYDIQSAYPYAFSLLPAWSPDDLEWVDGLDPKGRMGCYYVRWWLPDGANFYPFPFREKNGNVHFPPNGEGWVMSPEVYAAMQHWPVQNGDYYDFNVQGIQVVGGLVLRGTEAAGAGTYRLPNVCTSAQKLLEMAGVRLQAKHAGQPHEKALKLVINSVYGKTIQQVGAHKYLHTFAAAWITSVCRALAYRAVGPDWDHRVVSFMTDGVLSTVPLNVELGDGLGSWEVTQYAHATQLLPGVYQLASMWPIRFKVSRKTHSERKRKVKFCKIKVTRKYRGVSKDIDYEDALARWRRGESYPVTVRLFVTRSLALHQPKSYGDKRFQFVEVTRDENFSLHSKREVTDREDRTQPAVWFPAKTAPVGQASTPYLLNLEPVEVPYDQTLSQEELETQGWTSALEYEAYE